MFVNDFDIELRPTAEPSDPEGTEGRSPPQIWSDRLGAIHKRRQNILGGSEIPMLQEIRW